VEKRVWERIKQGIKDGASLSMEKIEEYTKVGKLKIDELATKRKIDRNFSDIGQVVFDLLEDGRGNDIKGNGTVKSAVKSIKELRQELVEIGAKIQQIQDEVRKARAARTMAEDEEPTGV
jgi:hypothetical protein